MTVYMGVDFHARVQTVCWCDLADGEIQIRELHHQEDDIRGFYAPFRGEVMVGLEAGGTAIGHAHGQPSRTTFPDSECPSP